MARSLASHCTLAAALCGLALVALARPARTAQAQAQARPGRRPARASSDLVNPWASRAPTPGSAALSEAERLRAEGLYERLCAPCHGARGEGDGLLAPYLAVAPRSFARDAYKWRSTPSGAAPTVDDLAGTIARGVLGGVMPAFGTSLAPDERALLARYVLAFAPARPPSEATARAPAPSAAELAAASVARGAALYEQLQCASCHGAALRGDGPATVAQPSTRPYDLTAHAPRGGATVALVARALRNGLDGTAMPAYEAALSPADAASLAAFVLARTPEGAARRATNDPGEAQWLPAAPAGLDHATPAPSGLLTDPRRAALERAHWAFPLAPQEPGPAGLAPAERGLEPERCARCHAAQFTQWRGTVHARAMGPGVLGQLVDMGPRDAAACQPCHAPLAEQHAHRALPAAVAPGVTPSGAPEGSGSMMAPRAAATASAAREGYAPNERFDEALRAQGVVCAACHLRGGERFGPPTRAAASAARLPGVHYPLTRLSRFERGDFCAPCHQHTPRDAIHGVPVLDTVNEWARGPYFARGVQCQHCHMPDREHTFRGAHDPDTVRQAVRVTARAVREGGAARVAVRVENAGAGHAFPGTTTPAAVLTITALDAQGQPVGTPRREVFQRHLEFDGRRLEQTFDTRLRPGEAREVTLEGLDARARSARYELVFRPDDYYEGFYRREARASWRSARGRALLEQALRDAERSPFVVAEGTVALP